MKLCPLSNRFIELTSFWGAVFCPVVWLSCVALVLSPVALPDTVFLLGRCPVDSVISLTAGPFFSDSSDQVLIEQRLGELSLFSLDDEARTKAVVSRLVLLKDGARGFEPVWRSGLMAEPKVLSAKMSSDVAAVGDFDLDRFYEVVLVGGDSIRIVKPVGGERTVEFSAGAVEGAIIADVDGDSFPELTVLETVFDSLAKRQVVKILGWQDGGLVLKGKPVAILAGEGDCRFSLLGAARLEDYTGMPVILGGEEKRVKPGVYGAVYAVSPDSFALTFLPFPTRDWFSKEEVLPAGRLQLFNIGDTLIAYGFFVPGSRPGGPAKSFAALQDGEWRLLRLRENAQRLSGLVCQFRYRGELGWLELRDGLFYFYPEAPFYWR